MSNRVIAAFALLLAAAGCYQDDTTGNTNRKPIAKVLLTDGPFPYDTVERVDVYIVSIAASVEPDTGDDADNMNWLTITEPRRRVNLLELQQGTTTLLGEGELPADQYKAVRLIIDTDSSAVIMMGGGEGTVNWGSPGEQAIHAFVEDAVAVPEEGAEIVIDFDVGRSFDYTNTNTFNFNPWIRAVNKAATGWIAGTIETDGDSTPLPTGPVRNARVSAWGNSQGNWQIFSTAATDVDGYYRLAYLRPGPYIVQVDPPATGSYVNFASALDSNITVAQGLETPHSVTLTRRRGSILINGAMSMLLGRENELEAFVIDAQGQPVTDPTVAWQTLDPTVLSVTDSARAGRFAWVTSIAIGTGRITATSGTLSDTLTIVVAADSSGGPIGRALPVQRRR